MRAISIEALKTVTATSVQQTSQVLQNISITVLWVGATMVLGGELTLGQLIAFRIIMVM